MRPVATEHLLYIPMPFTGGEVVGSILKQCGAVEVCRPHIAAVEIPNSWRQDRVVFGSVRDPWSWYLALWHALSAAPNGTMLLRHLGGGQTNFSAFLQGVTDPSVWMSAPTRFTKDWWDWPVGSDGLYTETIRALYNDGVEALVDGNALRAGLMEILGAPLPEFEHGRPPGQYQPREFDLVDQSDGDMSRQIGYSRPFEVLPHPVRVGPI